MLRRFLILIPLFCAVSLEGQLLLPRPSQKATVSQRVGVTDITIQYSRPGVKGRPIWGGLIPYGMVWRTGANESTTITFSSDVSVQGNKVARGTYSLHTIPSREEWTVILNRDTDEWGSFEYDKAKDVLRFNVKPQASEPQEWLLFTFPNVTDTSAEVALQWERIKISFNVDVDVLAAFVDHARAAVAAAPASDWQTAYRAAKFAFEKGVAAAETLAWVRRSVAAQEKFENVALEAKILAAAKNPEAVARARRAIELGQLANADVRELKTLVPDEDR